MNGRDIVFFVVQKTSLESSSESSLESSWQGSFQGSIQGSEKCRLQKQLHSTSSSIIYSGMCVE